MQSREFQKFVAIEGEKLAAINKKRIKPVIRSV
jgi:hypothetical protein